MLDALPPHRGHQPRPGRYISPDGFTARDVTRHGWRDLTAKDDVESALDLLEVKGWLRHLPEANIGRPKTAYAINPLIKLEI